jgi:subfamily B ATP-binding cassette protein MsbA
MVYLRPHIGRFTIAMIAIVIGSILGLAGPYTLQYLIDAVFTQNNAQLLNQITLILIIIFALQAVFYFIRAYQLQYIGERVMIDLRLNLFQHLQQLSLSFYNERRTGDGQPRHQRCVDGGAAPAMCPPISQVITLAP